MSVGSCGVVAKIIIMDIVCTFSSTNVGFDTIYDTVDFFGMTVIFTFFCCSGGDLIILKHYSINTFEW